MPWLETVDITSMPRPGSDWIMTLSAITATGMRTTPPFAVQIGRLPGHDSKASETRWDRVEGG